VNPDSMTALALLNCLVREVSAPEEQVWENGGHLMVRLARSGRLLRATQRRPSAGIGPRLTGEAQLQRGDSWCPVGWEQLARLIAAELTLATGTTNEEFAVQVRSSHAVMGAILEARQAAATRPAGDPPAGDPAAGEDDPRVGRYLASEQSLIAGHRFHPAPKGRGGDSSDWLQFAPETGARFPLRFLAVQDGALGTDGDTSGLDRLGAPAVPPGYQVLPAHPWQLQLLGGRPWLRRALRDRILVDLGDGPRDVVATSSVRTVYDPAADLFCKFSLDVRITNCVRKSSWYELAGSVELTRLLAPLGADLAERFPGTVLLGEPGYRTAALASEEAGEGLAVIVRDGIRGVLAPGVTPLLAASRTEPPCSPGARTAAGVPGADAVLAGGPGPLDDRDPDWLLSWWEAYVRAVAPPVLHALFGHGVVLEAHLQNVVVGLDAEGMPVQAIFRDLEGVKLLSPRYDAQLAALKPGVAHALAYDTGRGWSRVSYCLLVNHLAEIAAAIADRHPSPEDQLEADLWSCALGVLTEFASDSGWPPQLRAVLAGVPLPSKANLRLRWARAADREATYLPVINPLNGRSCAWSHRMAGAC
jgi:siderophore synthetase component